jgi:hypothetical protein
MMGKTIIKSIFLLAICVAMGFLLAGCGGSGGSGGSSAEGSSGTGSVALLLADGPADDYDQIFITITEVSLIPPEGRGRSPVVIFRNPAGIEVDLLDLRDEDYLLTVNRRVPAGVYEKIRLQISDIRPVGGPCLSLRLPSGKIDLNPRGFIEVVPNRTLSIRLDVDANKSINVSASCNFRPVVFVDIEQGAPVRACPRIVSGTISRIVKRGGVIVGFELELEGRRGELEVRVTDDTAVFDQNGEFGGRELLNNQENEQVKVRGRLDDEGRLQASVVVLGQVLEVKGKVDGPVDDTTDLFPFTPFPGEEVVGQRDVEVANETLILIGCDTEVGKEAIQAGMTARVIGKLVKINSTDVLRSVVVFLQAREVSGQITFIEDEVGGKIVTVEQETGGEVEIFVPSGTPINIEGDGSVPKELFCEGRQVRIFLDPNIPDPLTATLVLVQAERRVGEVTSVDEFDRTLIIDGESVFVQPGATILDTRGTVDTLVGFEEIDVNDQLEYFGLDACPGDMGFTAFVILITG